MEKINVSFGPEINRASWDWVGFDVSRELSKYFEISYFDNETKEAPACDVMIIIKEKPDYKTFQAVKRRGGKTIYCPIDFYDTRESLEMNEYFLRQCDAIIVHCERLHSIFAPYCPTVKFVEHHNRFGLAKPSDYKAAGYVLWIGAMEHLYRVVQWLRVHPLDLEIKFVTDAPLAYRDNLRGVLPIPDDHQVIRWSPRRQRDLMAGARAAFDIKGVDFSQMNKSPVKAQQFIASGIPFAVNSESYATEYFQARGIRLPSPADKQYWLSREYWVKTQPVGKKLREELTLEKIGLEFKRIIEQILKTK